MDTVNRQMDGLGHRMDFAQDRLSFAIQLTPHHAPLHCLQEEIERLQKERQMLLTRVVRSSPEKKITQQFMTEMPGKMCAI